MKKKYTKKELLTAAGRWSLAAALASVTGFLSWKSFRAGKLCKSYDKCSDCRDTSNCSLKADIKKTNWKAK
ncbi:MAG: hypothetical protein WCI43_01950 [Candidatus Firestonebacteria bacterium]